MIMDSLLEFSDAQAVSASAASTSSVDLGSDRDVGVGKPLYFVVQVTTALDDTNADETYVATLETDSDSGFATALATIATLTFARGDAAGTKKYVAVPSENLRYLRAYYTLGGTTPSGAFNAFLTSEHPEAWASVPDGQH